MIVMITGTFDLLHTGHFDFIEKASKYGDLYIGVGSDYSVEKYKNKKPIFNQHERVYMLKHIVGVKNAFVNSGEGQLDFEKEIKLLMPDYFIVNDDQSTEEKMKLCDELGISYMTFYREPPLNLPARSSTEIRSKL